ncbi:MAG: YbjN domain-containing protein [Muribaculaceae bacterium]|nr:YbjN domain-containing protein [Muribaculaceae bacterium]
MTIDKNLIRSYLDELNISTRIDDDGDMVIVQSADDDFGHDVVIFVMVNNNRLSYVAGAPGYAPDADPFFLANRHNCRRNMPTAVVRDGNIRMECSFLLDEEVSKEYIVENCIKMVLGSIWQAYVGLEKEE